MEAATRCKAGRSKSYMLNDIREVAFSVTMVSMLATLIGCGGGMEGQLKAGINEELGDEKVCFAITNEETPTWPLRVGRDWSGEMHPILAAMREAGHVEITEERQNFGGVVDVITPTKKAQGWWDDEEDGFCVGTRAVDEVLEWTEPGSAGPMGQMVEVKYTWRLTNVPSWAKGKEFKNIEGMAEPVESGTYLKKTNKGWKPMM